MISIEEQLRLVDRKATMALMAIDEDLLARAKSLAMPRPPRFPPVLADCLELTGWLWQWSAPSRSGVQRRRGDFATMAGKAAGGSIPVLWRHQDDLDALGRVLVAAEDHVGLGVRLLLNPPRSLFEAQVHAFAKAGRAGLSVGGHEYRDGSFSVDEVSLTPLENADHPYARLTAVGQFR